eukprot:TRINITY_DN4895_c0_g1_i1.p1 TRINITY_DN4895_c0_g1~~TRINITY_DN4895_c0_g1_i1.p1  ORF type:complete len:290 (+),score=63.31 TRINITY_DN4895_c0_g1_i1:159-1028(+)
MVKLITKVKYGEDIRRLTFDEKPTFEELFKLLTELYKNTPELQNFTIKYVDDEEDFISLTNDREIIEAWNLATSHGARDGTLRLVLTSTNSKDSSVNQSDVSTTTLNNSTNNTANNTEATFRDNPVDVNACVNKIINDVGNANPNLKSILESNDVQNLIQQYQPLIQQFMPTIQQLASNGFNTPMNNPNSFSAPNNPTTPTTDPNISPNLGNLFAQFLPMFANMMPPPPATTTTNLGTATPVTNEPNNDMQEKLNELENMGFMDRQLNEKILEQNNEDLGNSIQILLAL